MTYYKTLCESANINPIKTHTLLLQEFNSYANIADKTLEERITASLQVFVDLLVKQPAPEINKNIMDYYIAQIDCKISDELNSILHHPEFQALESLWTSLKYLVDHTDFNANTDITLLDVSKELLIEDFSDSADITQSQLYKQIYIEEYDTPGGEPLSAMISDFEFDASAKDIALLRELSKIAATAHCPFIGNAGANFFHKNTMDEVMRIDDLSRYLERAEYIRWNAFRQTDDARYIGLTLPKFLLRLPYDEAHHPVKSFLYHENVFSDINHYLWGKSSFAFAANMTKSFKKNGWAVNIRGPQSGGRIDHLPLHHYETGHGLQTKIPSEILIPETRELELANAGFIPLSYYKNSDFACFFSANSIQKPLKYDTDEATANSRINAKLPYIFLSARLGHYLKVLQRENIGASKNREGLESELNRWIQSLVTKMNHPGPELAATHPLKEGYVNVIEIPDNPGYYRVNLFAIPHFQVEGIDVRLSLVAQLPNNKKEEY